MSESRRTLYVDDRPLAAGCISFAVHDEFLLLTTTSHTCRFLSLHSNPSGTYTLLYLCAFYKSCTLSIPCYYFISCTCPHPQTHVYTELSPLRVDRPHALDEMVRRVERGSRIVTAIPRDIRVILQVSSSSLFTQLFTPEAVSL